MLKMLQGNPALRKQIKESLRAVLLILINVRTPVVPPYNFEG